jgi:sortase (surface protein transpeptidase)
MTKGKYLQGGIGMNLFECIGLVAIITIAIRAVKTISIERYRQKAMHSWAHEKRQIDRRKSQNREGWRWY